MDKGPKISSIVNASNFQRCKGLKNSSIVIPVGVVMVCAEDVFGTPFQKLRNTQIAVEKRCSGNKGGRWQIPSLEGFVNVAVTPIVVFSDFGCQTSLSLCILNLHQISTPNLLLSVKVAHRVAGTGTGHHHRSGAQSCCTSRQSTYQ